LNQLVLKWLNPVLLVLFVLIASAIQTSLFNSYPLLYLQPDCILLAVMWVSLKRPFTEGGILTLIFANIAEVHSSATQGVLLLTYMLIFLILKALDRYLLLRQLTSLVSLTLFVSIAWKLLSLGLLLLLGVASNQWRHTFTLLLPGAVMEGVVSIWVFRWLEKFDIVTQRDARSQRSLGDELHLEEEGL